MKYLKTYESRSDSMKRTNKEKSWIKSIISDIVDCSTDLTDLPYNFKHCGNYTENNDENDNLSEYLSVVTNHTTMKKKYTIKYIGKIIDEKVSAFCAGNYIDRGDGVGKIITNKIEVNHLDIISIMLNKRNDKGSKLLVSLLDGLEDTISKLSNMVFVGDYKISFFVNIYSVSRGTAIIIGVDFLTT